MPCTGCPPPERQAAEHASANRQPGPRAAPQPTPCRAPPRPQPAPFQPPPALPSTRAPRQRTGCVPPRGLPWLHEPLDLVAKSPLSLDEGVIPEQELGRVHSGFFVLGTGGTVSNPMRCASAARSVATAISPNFSS